MLKKIGLAFVLLLVAYLLFAATRPDSFRLERSVVVKAPPDKVFAFVNDFRQWPAWSPWEKLDPAMQRTHGGAATGAGANYAWKGNSQVGSGRMEITDSAAPGKVVIKLDFLEPFEAHNTTEFSFVPEADGTRVTWAMSGPMHYVNKLMSVVISMDAMVGKDFEAGLANLKAAAEK